jgi:hypothetical protein
MPNLASTIAAAAVAALALAACSNGLSAATEGYGSSSPPTRSAPADFYPGITPLAGPPGGPGG